MIERGAIIEWNEHVPWNDYSMVEQDLIICRVLIAIYSNKFLSSQLAFRGGTALNKLYIFPQPRYSEDIDLVQISPGPIKPILFALGKVLDFLPNRVIKQKRYNNTMFFRSESEIPPKAQLRIKVEINCCEHFNVLGLRKMPFGIENRYFSGSCELTTYCIEELLGTKLRALCQRKKGRDLFDIYIALNQVDVDCLKVVKCYQQYIGFVVDHLPTYKQFVNNLSLKISDNEFVGDTKLLLRPKISYNPEKAFSLVKEQLLCLLPGANVE